LLKILSYLIECKIASMPNPSSSSCTLVHDAKLKLTSFSNGGTLISENQHIEIAILLHDAKRPACNA
ncbi:MAG: hypothetical protein NT027_17005, partial [Proteobacteria bacterium]|nr:hypothetical protein [Pseudomonadota bacterium]